MGLTAVLNEAKLTKSQSKIESDPDKLDVKAELNAAGLDLRSMFEQIADQLENSENEILKQKMREAVLKMHGALKDNATPPPQAVTIVINDPGSNFSINPILIPRETQRELVS